MNQPAVIDIESAKAWVTYCLDKGSALALLLRERARAMPTAWLLVPSDDPCWVQALDQVDHHVGVRSRAMVIAFLAAVRHQGLRTLIVEDDFGRKTDRNLGEARPPETPPLPGTLTAGLWQRGVVVAGTACA